ncbi:MAG: hypothetical protein AAGF11_19240 [Myxococcota bacterium]
MSSQTNASATNTSATDTSATNTSATNTPARLALSLDNYGSSGLIDIANLRAEPLPLSLVSAGLTSTPPPTPRPAPPPSSNRRPWILGAMGAALGLTLAMVGMVAVVQPSPTIVVERPVTIDRQLSMQEAEAAPVMTTVGRNEHERAPKHRAKAETKTTAAEPTPDADPDATAKAKTKTKTKTKTKAKAKTSKRSTQRSTGKDAPSSNTPQNSGSTSIPVECVLDPARCTPSGTPKRTSPPGDRSAPEPLPSKLSTHQLKAALATTKADARRCGPEHGTNPGAKVQVKLSIEGKTGTVISSAALGEYAGTSLGRCVAAALRHTKFPRFSATRMGTLYSVRL